MNTAAKKTEKILSSPLFYTVCRVILISVLSRTHIVGTYPFGIAYAAFFAEENPFAALLAVSLGSALTGKLSAIKYISAALVFAVTVYFRKFKDHQVKAVALGASLIISSAVFALASKPSPAQIILIVPEAFAAGGLYYLFSFSGDRGIFAYCRGIILFGACLGGIYGLKLPYIGADIAVLAGMLIIMSIAMTSGVPVAAFTGAILGFMIFTDDPSAVEIAGVFALSSAFASALSKNGRAGVSAGFLSGVTVSVLSMGRLSALSVADIFTAPIIFLVLPENITVKTGKRVSRFLSEDILAGEDFKRRLETFAQAIRDLGNGVKNLSEGGIPENDSYGSLYDRVCLNCRNREYCSVNIKALENTMERDGFLNSSNAPYGFGAVCERPEKFITEFSHVYELNKQNELFRGEASYDRTIALNQYGELSDIISSLSCLAAEEPKPEEKKELFSVKLSVCQEPCRGQDICGDTVIHFQKEHRYFVILCDGIGSGQAARDISSLSAQLFAEFLSSGIDKKSTVNIINSALALNSDKESFSSADILEIDLFTGRAEFFKIGCAQSFIKRGDKISEISSCSLPVGILENIDVEPQDFRIMPDDIILMVSDGISEAAGGIMKNDWIKRILLSGTEDVEALAKRFTDGAKSRTAYSDDMTSIVIKIEGKE